MKTLIRLTTSLTNKALGTVDAGACITDRGCCCNSANTYGLDCYGHCVKEYCSTTHSAYGQPCFS